jgi:predicted ABC-type sugar transport system permease subunit
MKRKETAKIYCIKHNVQSDRRIGLKIYEGLLHIYFHI